MPAFRSLLPFALVASLTSANAEILLLDDFTVPLDFNTVQITGNDTSMSGQVGNYLWLQQGTQASWQDTGSTDHIIGGTRSVEVSSLALATPILDHVKIAINPQVRLDIATGNSSCLEYADFTYDISGSDISEMNYLWIDVASLDFAAAGAICASLTLSDGVTSATKILGMCTEEAGADRFWFSDMPELLSGQLQREDITTATIQLTSSAKAADFRINAIYMTVSNPEPAPFALLLAGFACVVLKRRFVTRRSKGAAATTGEL